MGFLENFFSGREIEKLRKRAQEINSLESSISTLTDSQLREKTQAFTKRLAEGQTLDDILNEAFAVCRDASQIVLNMRHFDVQLIVVIVLH